MYTTTMETSYDNEYVDSKRWNNLLTLKLNKLTT